MEHTTSTPRMGRRLSLQAFHELCTKRDEQLSSFIKPVDKVSSTRRNALFITSPAMLPNIPLQLKSAPTTPRKVKSESNGAGDEPNPVLFDDPFAGERHKRNVSVQSNGSWNSGFSDGTAGPALPSTPASSVFAGNVDVEPQRKDSLPKEEMMKETMRWLLADDQTA